MPPGLKSIAHWLVYAGLIMFAGGLILLGKADAVLVERLRMQVSDPLAPVLNALSRPADFAADGLDRVRGWVGVTEENERLRRERDDLLLWRAAAKHLEAENAGLRRLLNYVPDPEASYRSARIIANSSGVFAQSVMVNAGTLAGVAKGQIVLDGAGVVGRIVGVSGRAGRVLLLTDLNSRVPVFVGPERHRAVLAGDNSETPKLIHVVPGETIKVGDDVVTSGIAGGFPPGLPVGIVVTVDDRHITVALNTDRDRLEYVRIADFGIATGDVPLPGRSAAAASRPARPAAANQKDGGPIGAPPAQRADAR